MSNFVKFVELDSEFQKFGYVMISSNDYSMTIAKDNIKYRINFIGSKYVVFTTKPNSKNHTVRYDSETYYKQGLYIQDRKISYEDIAKKIEYIIQKEPTIL